MASQFATGRWWRCDAGSGRVLVLPRRAGTPIGPRGAPRGQCECQRLFGLVSGYAATRAPELQREFSARHPGADYNREQASFLEALRTATGSDKILFLNQGYGHDELFLPHADFDLTESYFVGASAGETHFRPWDDPADPWHSILAPMEQLVVPASRRFPSVKFVHLGYAAGPEERACRAIVYNHAAAKLWDHGAYLVAESPVAEQDKAYFSDLGRPLTATYAQVPGQGVAWREFEGGVVALNTGSRTTSILDGCYQLPDPPRGYVFRQ